MRCWCSRRISTSAELVLRSLIILLTVCIYGYDSGRLHILSRGASTDAVCRRRGRARRQRSLRPDANEQQVRSERLRQPGLCRWRHTGTGSSMFRASSLPHRQPRGTLLVVPELSARPQVLRQSQLSLSQRSAKTTHVTLLSAKVTIVPHRIVWSRYTGRWWVGCYIWYSEEGTGRDCSKYHAFEIKCGLSIIQGH